MELDALDDLAQDMIVFANTPGTQKNKKCHENRYLEFCQVRNLPPFPITEWRLVCYAMFLSFSLQTVDSIKSYCGMVCELNELYGFPPVVKGKRFKKALDGIKRMLAHEVKQASPITVEMLQDIVNIVNVNSLRELSVWVATLFGFFLFLRKSNLVPTDWKHDVTKQLSRKDLKLDEDLLIVTIKWSKTIQFAQRKLQLPLVADFDSDLCPVRWLIHVIDKIPASGEHNLFCYPQKGHLVPVNYYDLMTQLRKWLKAIGVNDVNRFSSHSLRRGGYVNAFENGVQECTLSVPGDWASECYKRYIDMTVETRVKAWFLISK